MLKPDRKQNRKQKKMTDQQRQACQRAVSEEKVGKVENVETARGVAKRLKDERKFIADLVAQLRGARERAGVSLSVLESRTGINKSSLSRLENSEAPNPTLLTLQRYAMAIGFTLKYVVAETEPGR